MNQKFKEWVEKHKILQAQFMANSIPKEGALYNGFMGSVGDGWVGILDELAEKLIATGWDRKLFQVKEKFGTLRFYQEGGLTEEQYGFVREAERKSETTCEYCGQPGKLRDGAWVLTLCDACAKQEDVEQE